MSFFLLIIVTQQPIVGYGQRQSRNYFETFSTPKNL